MEVMVELVVEVEMPAAQVVEVEMVEEAVVAQTAMAAPHTLQRHPRHGPTMVLHHRIIPSSNNITSNNKTQYHTINITRTITTIIHIPRPVIMLQQLLPAYPDQILVYIRKV